MSLVSGVRMTSALGEEFPARRKRKVTRVLQRASEKGERSNGVLRSRGKRS
jgi:hypothetical protein